MARAGPRSDKAIYVGLIFMAARAARHGSGEALYCSADAEGRPGRRGDEGEAGLDAGSDCIASLCSAGMPKCGWTSVGPAGPMRPMRSPATHFIPRSALPPLDSSSLPTEGTLTLRDGRPSVCLYVCGGRLGQSYLERKQCTGAEFSVAWAHWGGSLVCTPSLNV